MSKLGHNFTQDADKRKKGEKLTLPMAPLVAQTVKNLPAMQEIQLQSLG